MKSKSKYILSLIGSLAAIISPKIVSAALVVDCAQTDGRCTLIDLFRQIAKVTNYLIAFAGVFAVLMIVVAGFMLVIAQDNPKGGAEARKKLTNAVIGFIVVMIAYLAVNTIFTAIGAHYGVQFYTSLFGTK